MSNVIPPLRPEDDVPTYLAADTTPSAPVPCSGRKPRSDRLLHYGVDPAHAKVVKQRITPLARYYWLRLGSVSIDDLCMSAYIQGMMDAQQLPPTNGQNSASTTSVAD